MKNNWKNDFESKCESGHFKIGEIDKSLLVKFIESLLAEQKKELIGDLQKALKYVVSVDELKELLEESLNHHE